MKRSDISLAFTVHAPQDGASASDLAAFSDRFGSVDGDYAELVTDSATFELTHPNGGYFRLWAPDYAVEMDEDYMVSELLPGAVPIADDGNSRVIYLRDGGSGRGLYLCEMGALIDEEEVWVSGSLRDLLSEENGVDKLLVG